MLRKQRIPALILTALLLASLAGCKDAASDNDALWKAAMTDAVFSDDEEIHELVALTKEDDKVIWDDAEERVLLLSWHNYDDACAPGRFHPDGIRGYWATSLGRCSRW